MKSLVDVCGEVGRWSVMNFGFQETQHLVGALNESVALPDGDVITVRLGSTAPLMGIVEEIGELFEAETEQAFFDAVADICIYLMDYVCREGATWPEGKLHDTEDEFDPVTGLVVMCGRLHHATLKRHQGIRGFDRAAVYEEARDAAVARLVYYLETVAVEVCESTLQEMVNDTWANIVSKRNWKV
jgi:hypothetical protein